MAKPIFIVKVPESLKEYFGVVTNSVRSGIKDYHCITVLSNVQDFEFQVFYEKDFNEVKYEELKQIVKEFCKL